MQQQLLPGLLFDKRQVASALGRSEKTIARWLVDDVTFPRPFRIKGKETWRSDEIIAWVLEQQILERLAAFQCLDKPGHSGTLEKVEEIPTSGKRAKG